MTEYGGWQRSIKKRSIYEAAKRVDSEGGIISCITIRDDMNKFKTNQHNLNAREISALVRAIPVMYPIGVTKIGPREYTTYGFKREWE